MQAVVAKVCQLQARSVLRSLVFVAGVAVRATKRAAERFARREALIYATREITVADILLYATATFEDVDDVPPEPEPVPAPAEPDIKCVIAIIGGTVAIAGAVFVGLCIADAVAEHRRTMSRPSHEAPPCIQEDCQAAGIKHRLHQVVFRANAGRGSS